MSIITTYSGVQLDILAPRQHQIYPVDIAVGLSRECMYNNATKHFYSVAEHSVHCMQLCEIHFPHLKSLPFKALTKFSASAYMRFVTGSLLNVFGGEYMELYYQLQDAIDMRFGIKWNEEEKKSMSMVLAEAERIELQEKVNAWWGLKLTHEAARDVWLEHFKEKVQVPVVLSPTDKQLF